MPEEIPEGMELVSKDKLKALATAGNDLTKLKSALDDLPEGYDLSKLISEFKDIKTQSAQAKMDEATRLESKLSEERSKREKLERQLSEKEAHLKKMKIANDSTNFINETRNREGKVLSQRFVDQEKLYSLDPESDTYTEALVSLHKEAYEIQMKELEQILPKSTIPSIEITHRDPGFNPQKIQSELQSEGMAIGMSDKNYYNRFIERKQ